ncbi:hypothetical protein [Trueperella pyogenes]|nr:hypothetical protein [Trueperella pyogenes]MCI7688944.1 hypothetical protein [Trueperella pyogenes]
MATRISGKTLSLKVDGTEYAAEIAEYELSDNEKDGGTVTFKAAEDGSGVAQTLKVTFVQSLDASSLHQAIYDHPGKTGVPFLIAPFGNAEASPSQPHITGTCDFPRLRPKLGLKAGDIDATAEVELAVSSSKKITSNARD